MYSRVLFSRRTFPSVWCASTFPESACRRFVKGWWTGEPDCLSVQHLRQQWRRWTWATLVVCSQVLSQRGCGCDSESTTDSRGGWRWWTWATLVVCSQGLSQSGCVPDRESKASPENTANSWTRTQKLLVSVVQPFQFQTALSLLFNSASFYLTWPDGARVGWGVDKELGCLLKLVSQFALLRVAKKYETEWLLAS